MLDPWASGVLKKRVHQPLVRDLERLSLQAGIAPHWVCQSLKGHVGDSELDWVRRFRKWRSKRGLLYLGPYAPDGAAEDVGDRMAALCGALIRNFIDARVRSTEEVLEEDRARFWTCLLLPSFCTEGDSALRRDQRRSVADLLLTRSTAGLQTVVYAPSYEAVAAAYGDTVRQVVERRFLTVETS